MRLLWLLIPLIPQTNALLEFEVPSINHIELDIGKFDGYRPYHYKDQYHSYESRQSLSMHERLSKDDARFQSPDEPVRDRYMLVNLNLYYVNYKCGSDRDVQVKIEEEEREYYSYEDWKGAEVLKKLISDCEEEYTCEKFVTRPDDFQGIDLTRFRNATLITRLKRHGYLVTLWRTFTACEFVYYPEFYDRLQKLGFDEVLLFGATPAQLLALRKIAQHPLMDWRKTVYLPESRVAERDKLWAVLNERELKNYEYTYLLATGQIENPEDALEFD